MQTAQYKCKSLLLLLLMHINLQKLRSLLVLGIPRHPVTHIKKRIPITLTIDADVGVQ